MKKVLVIEDDQSIVDLLSIHLKDPDCDVDTAYDELVGQEKALNNPYDLIVLYIMLPCKDGISIAQKLRPFDVPTPIMMLTVKSKGIDKVLGLESGAYDDLTKPFGVREFIALVKAIFRGRSKTRQQLIPVL